MGMVQQLEQYLFCYQLIADIARDIEKEAKRVKKRRDSKVQPKTEPKKAAGRGRGSVIVPLSPSQRQETELMQLADAAILQRKGMLLYLRDDPTKGKHISSLGELPIGACYQTESNVLIERIDNQQVRLTCLSKVMIVDLLRM
jgi:hypothetical protein